MKIKKICKVCNNNFESYYEKTKFCSRKCFHSQHRIWLGKKRPEHSKIMKKLYKEGIRTPIMMVGSDNPQWKDKASYSAIHHWLEKHMTKDGICYFCDKEPSTRTEFANISGKYKREINDYLELCPSCHRLLDYKNYSKLPVSMTYLKKLGFL